MTMELRVAGPGDLDALTAVMATAFRHDPVWGEYSSGVVRSARRRRRGLARLPCRGGPPPLGGSLRPRRVVRRLGASGRARAYHRPGARARGAPARAARR